MKRKLVALWLCCGCLMACEKRGAFRSPAASLPAPECIQVQLADSSYISYDGYVQVHPISKTSATYILYVNDQQAGMTLEFQMVSNTANTDQTCTFTSFDLHINGARPAQWNPVNNPTVFATNFASGFLTAAYTGRAVCVAGDSTGVTKPLSINFKNVPVIY